MKLRIKKIIAREFLTLIVIVLLSVLFGLCIYPYNSFRQSQINSIEKKITAQRKKSDSLSFAYNKKRIAREAFFTSLTLEFNITASDQNTTDKTWKILSKVYHSDSIPINYRKTWDSKLVKFLKSKGYNDGKAFEKFVGENLLSKTDSLNYLQSEKLNQDISALKIQSNHLKYKIFELNEQIKFSLLILIRGSLITCFFCRYFGYIPQSENVSTQRRHFRLILLCFERLFKAIGVHWGSIGHTSPTNVAV